MESHFCCVLSVLVVSCYVAEAVTPPTWPAAYNISGTLRLPYAELNEPFVGWYEATRNRSRVDFYDSSVITIQIGSVKGNINGTTYQIVPAFMNDQNVRKCFQVNGTVAEPSTIQAVLPDLNDFQLQGEAMLSGVACDVWQMVEKKGQKNNKYTMWVSKKGDPVRYEMMGYDTLLGSHYDKYYLDYNMMNTFKTIPDDIFRPIKGMTCGDFPGPGDAEHKITMNPMREYINNDDHHIDDMFDKFTRRHGKRYINYVERHSRKHQFRQNVRFIHSKNRVGLSYRLAVNHLADLSDKELARMRGYKYSHTDHTAALPFHSLHIKHKDVPDSLDWRLYGAVTPVKDQATCGSCWSFGTSGAVEGAYFVKTGELVRLSQQELMDCSWDQGNNACDGGEDFRAYDFIKKHGLATEDDYGHYLGQDGFCHYKNVSARVTMKDYVNVTSTDEQALKIALTTYGPVSVAIDASHKSLSFYANGVYFEPQCRSDPDSLDHAVLAVGYGVMNGQAYWLIKNSWSTYWGNSGFVLMSQRDNNCGVATAATFVLM